MQPTDEALMLDYQRGRPDAIRQLFDRHKGRVFGYCLQLLGNRADAEEAAGDVFMAVVERRGSYNYRHPFATWLFAIAHNTCVSRMRKRHPVLSLWVVDGAGEESPRDIPDARPLPSERAMHQEAAGAIRVAIGRLPDEQREAIILRHYQEFSYDEISVILKCSLEKVKILIYRGRERLRVELASLVKEES